MNLLLINMLKLRCLINTRKFIIILILIIPNKSYADTPIIAIASNLTAPMTEIVSRFKIETGETIRLSFGSSGNLARQIIQGAPYDLFISAGIEYVDFLSEHGAPIKSTSEYIYGDIGFYIPKDSTINNSVTFNSLVHALNFNSYRKIAFANPEHAPYGIAALQALVNAGLWAVEKDHLLLAESVSQVVPFAMSGNVDIAIIPYSFMQQTNLNSQGSYFPIPTSWYSRISQYIVEFNNTSEISQKFRDYLDRETAQNIFMQHGYHHIGNE
jgi:molybdate transport system substrate-binding protein